MKKKGNGEKKGGSKLPTKTVKNVGDSTLGGSKTKMAKKRSGY